MVSTPEQEIHDQASAFALLGDPTRLRLLKLLGRQREPNALCVNALAHVLGVTQSAVSQHLRVLKQAGLVNRQRRGYRVHYFVSPEGLAHCRGLVSAALNMQESQEEASEKPPCPAKQGKCSKRKSQARESKGSLG